MKMQNVIVTRRLILRPLGAEDTEEVFQFASDPENARYMIYLPVRTREGTRQFLKEAEGEWRKEVPSYYEFAILRKPVDKEADWGNRDCGTELLSLHPVIGEISLWLHEGDAELGWILDKRQWNRGFITEAAGALIETARRQLDCQRFTAHCDDENAASYHVMEKLGMRMTDRYGGRKNRLSPEERLERFYTMPFITGRQG